MLIHGLVCAQLYRVLGQKLSEADAPTIPRSLQNAWNCMHGCVLSLKEFCFAVSAMKSSILVLIVAFAAVAKSQDPCLTSGSTLQTACSAFQGAVAQQADLSGELAGPFHFTVPQPLIQRNCQHVSNAFM